MKSCSWRTHDRVNDKVWSTSKILGKPQAFKGESARLTEWLRKTTGFLIAAYGSAFQPVNEWVEDQDNTVTDETLDQQFALGAEPVDDVQEKG